jgi:uncharacterized membrane protein HdeD (DUF308 family)
MQSIAQLCRSSWWAFAASGVAALAAAVVVAAAFVSPPPAVGAWQFLSGILILVAARGAPGGVRSALPFLGAAAIGIVLGLAGLLLPSNSVSIVLIAIGIWGVVLGAGYLAVARLARAFRVPDGGLYAIAWASLGVGIFASTLPAFKLGASLLVPAAALVATGIITIVASTRLRVLQGEATPPPSKREARRRERAGRAR